jgi:hypothetical protein
MAASKAFSAKSRCGHDWRERADSCRSLKRKVSGKSDEADVPNS